MPEHPDHEQLAAYQAGEVDRRQRADLEAHLSGCSSCTQVVASVEHARGRLAMLEAPELPLGLHDRLAAAVRSEAEAGAGLPRRPTPWYRRPAAFAAAAALLLIALAAPLLDLDLSGGDDRTAAGAGASGQRELAGTESSAGGSGLPVIRLPGEVSAATVRATLTSDPRARLALEQATGGQQAATAQEDTKRGAQAPGTQGEEGVYGGGGAPSTVPAAPTDRQACLAAATAAAGPALQPLVPVLYVEGTYRGQLATVLVTTSDSQPGRTDIWVFPLGDCSSPPLATERVP